MKLTVLLDNNTLIGRYYLAEPGVSYLIEDDDRKILFDAGYSGAFLENARRMSVDLLDLDFVVLSHGHLDHTWGLVALIRLYAEASRQGRRIAKPTLVAHPATLLPKTYGKKGSVGSLLSESELARRFDLHLSREPVRLTDRLTFLGEVPRTTEFEATEPIGTVEVDGAEQDDFVIEDSALAHESPDGLVVVTGCSHAGICNIVERAKEVCGDDRVVDVVGGLHLLDPSEEQLRGTLAYMDALSPTAVHACHCTDLRSKVALAGVVELKEVGVGLRLEY